MVLLVGLCGPQGQGSATGDGEVTEEVLGSESAQGRSQELFPTYGSVGRACSGCVQTAVLLSP